jgi:osmotically-inducible protein OsmY
MQEVLSLTPSDSELEGRARSLLRWKIRFNSVHVAAVSGHVTLSGEVISALDRETAEQTIRKLRGVVGVTNCIIAGPTGPAFNRSHGSQRNTSRRVVGALPVQRLKA